MFELRNSDKSALVINHKTISYTELNGIIEKYHRHYVENDVVYVLTAKASEAFLGLLLSGLMLDKKLAIIPHNLSNPEEENRLKLLGEYFRFDDTLNKRYYKNAGGAIPHSDARLILFTTGSTGMVKGVQLSKDNILSNCQAVIASLNMTEVESQVLFLPLSYSFGLLGQLLPGLLTGLTTTILDHFIQIKTLFETGNIPDMWSGVPSHFQAILQLLPLAGENKTLIKQVVSAGAPMGVKLREHLREALPQATIYLNYGLTEASPRVLCLSSHSPLFLTQATGYPIGDWQIKVTEQSELLIKGKQVMLGYLGEDANPICSGWLNTGDIAEINSDNLVTIKARQQMVIKVGGKKVNLSQLEATIGALSGITEAVILPVEDDFYGHRLMAFIESNCSKEALINHAQKALYPNVCPIEFLALKALPRHENGKVNRKALAAKVQYAS